MKTISNRELQDNLHAFFKTSPPAGLAENLERKIPTWAHARSSSTRSWVRGILVAGLAGVAAVLFLVFGLSSSPRAYADVLGPVAEATSQAKAIHVVMRTMSKHGEDFSYVNLGGDFQRMEISIDAGSADDAARMRIEKEDRVYLLTPEETVVYHPQLEQAFRTRSGSTDLRLLRPGAWVESILNNTGELVVLALEENGNHGRALFQMFPPDLGSERPVFFEDFERRLEIQWETDSQRLTSLKRWVQHEGNWLLVTETISIDYPVQFEDKVFELDLGSEVRFGVVAKVEPAIAALAPEEVARRFWQAAVDGDWKTVELFCHVPAVIDWLKANQPTAVLAIGKAERKATYPGVFVPYKVRFGQGEGTWEKEFRLALRNDNEQKRYVFDGGI